MPAGIEQISIILRGQSGPVRLPRHKLRYP